MPIDYQTSHFIRHYPDEIETFRRLPFITKSVAAYVRGLVDPTHGWIRLRGCSVEQAFRTRSSGPITRSDIRLLGRIIPELLDDHYLVKCHRYRADIGTLHVGDWHVPLSSWVQDPNGDWVVIPNWIPAQYGLSSEQAKTWQNERIQRIWANLAQGPAGGATP